jgi:hypothetical protein
MYAPLSNSTCLGWGIIENGAGKLPGLPGSEACTITEKENRYNDTTYNEVFSIFYEYDEIRFY